MFTDYTGEVTWWLPFLAYKALIRVIEKYEDMAKAAVYNSEEEMQDYMKEIRREVIE